MKWSSVVSYSDGELVWAIPRPGIRAGRPVGYVNPDGYRVFYHSGRKHMAHRVIWEILRGSIPDGMQIDHKDGDPRNNRIDNLRLATPAQNARNVKSHSDATSRFVGVSWYKPGQKWRATIWANGRQNSLGYFTKEEDAVAARERAAQRFFGNFVRKESHHERQGQ